MVNAIRLALFIGVSLLSHGCATTHHVEATEAAATSSTTQYLVGEASSSSPDGKTPFGPPIAVRASREINLTAGTIVEHSWHRGEHHQSFFTRRGETLVFDVRNEKDSYHGTVTFSSADIAKASVTYNIAMTDGSGTLTGTGAWSGHTYRTDKIFSDPTGTPRARINETLTMVTKKAFDVMASPE
ncbi:MAG: hypothetical protein ACPGU1_13245 [Myxococcota bacterium]